METIKELESLGFDYIRTIEGHDCYVRNFPVMARILAFPIQINLSVGVAVKGDDYYVAATDGQRGNHSQPMNKETALQKLAEYIGRLAQFSGQPK